MSHQPKVSVILPVYNRAGLVSRAIDSVLAQTCDEFELIVIDDASDDGTLEIVQSYEADPRVRVFQNGHNLGPSGSRNRGVGVSRAPYIAFQDSDDRWLPEKLSRQISVLEKSPAVSACYCGALYYAPGQCYYIPSRESEGQRLGDLSTEILFGNPTTPQTLLVRRDALVGIGLFDESLTINEDWDLVIRLAQKAQFAFVDEPLAIIYRTGGSVSSDSLKDAQFREILLTRYADLYGQNRNATSRQHYVAGSIFAKSGAHERAFSHFFTALRLAPGIKTLAQTVRSGLCRFAPRSHVQQ